MPHAPPLNRTTAQDQNLKLSLLFGAGAGVICSIAYRSLQHVHRGVPAARADCLAWQWLAFSPGWIWLYCSFFVLVGVAWLRVPARSLRRFAGHFLGTAATGWVFFALWPTACIRPPLPPDGSWAYRTLLALDGPENCFPCLHTALGIVAAFAIAAHTRPSTRVVVSLLLLGWLVTINASIIGLRQHTGIDIAAGAALGTLAGCSYFRQTLRVRN